MNVGDIRYRVIWSTGADSKPWVAKCRVLSKNRAWRTILVENSRGRAIIKDQSADSYERTAIQAIQWSIRWNIVSHEFARRGENTCIIAGKEKQAEHWRYTMAQRTAELPLLWSLYKIVLVATE